MRIALRIAGVAALVALSAHAAKADIIPFTATLSGASEVPPNGSAGTGLAILFMDTVANTLSYTITYGGLSADETTAHIHGYQPVGVSAGVVHTLPIAQGLKTGTWNYATDANETKILNGLTYVNIHSMEFTNGELRGQILRTDVGVEGKTWTGVKALYAPAR